MAYTKIIVIRGRLDKCLSYAANEEKTYLETAVDYALGMFNAFRKSKPA